MRAHRTDLLSLAFALIFLGVAGWWLVAQLVGFVAPAAGWFVAGALLLVGLLGLIGAVRAARSAGAARTPAGAPGSPTGLPRPGTVDPDPVLTGPPGSPLATGGAGGGSLPTSPAHGFPTPTAMEPTAAFPTPEPFGPTTAFPASDPTGPAPGAPEGSAGSTGDRQRSTGERGDD